MSASLLATKTAQVRYTPSLPGPARAERSSSQLLPSDTAPTVDPSVPQHVTMPAALLGSLA